MKTEKEKWQDDVISSLDGMQRAEPNPFLYTKIISKISAEENEYTPIKLVWLAAASFALLIVLNIQILKKNNKREHTNKNTVDELANQYQLQNNNTINYN